MHESFMQNFSGWWKEYWWLVSIFAFRRVDHKVPQRSSGSQLEQQVDCLLVFLEMCFSDNTFQCWHSQYSCVQLLQEREPSLWLQTTDMVSLVQLSLLCIINSTVYAPRCVITLLQTSVPMKSFNSRQGPVITCYLSRIEGGKLLRLSGLMGQMCSETSYQGR